VPYTAKSLKEIISDTMTDCLRLLENFEKLREGDEMIYFSTPDKVGIGISRGPACCTSSGGTIIDYSGRVINLASRLNDFARPSGVVFDSGLGLTLLPKEMQDLFLCENVYVRGIAEEKPIKVHFTKQCTIIPSDRKQPLKQPLLVTKTWDVSYKHLKEGCDTRATFYSKDIEQKPFDEKQMYLEVSFEIAGGTGYFNIDTSGDSYVRYFEKGGACKLQIEFARLMKKLQKYSIGDDQMITFKLGYRVT
jgi:hypothetical protein